MAYVLLLALVALGIPLAVSLRDRVDSEVRSQAKSEADVVAATAAESIEHFHLHTLERLTRRSARTVRGRVLIVDRGGRVIADSAGRLELGVDYSSRPEIAVALAGDSYQETRHSDTLNQDLLATSVPILLAGRTLGAVRVTQSVEAVDSAVRRSLAGLVLLGGIVLLLGLIAGALIAQQIARPIHRLEVAARKVAAGDLGARAAIEGSAEQRTLARSFNEMTERVERLLRGQQDFVADASHQLRTPLTGLRLQIEELREAVPADDPQADRLDAGLREIDRLSQMVDELLILSRAGEHELPGADVDLDETSFQTVERWRSAADDAGIALELEAGGDGGTVWCAAADLDRALDALVENAIRYSPRGSTVTVACAPGRIEVLDEGSGLEPGEEEAVFERFYRGRVGRRGQGGTGLGLPIARELVEQWDGTVTLANRDDGGARAAVEWPPREGRSAGYPDRR